MEQVREHQRLPSALPDTPYVRRAADPELVTEVSESESGSENENEKENENEESEVNDLVE
jgi:hypothetical protein